jgi:hypothetical protein
MKLNLVAAWRYTLAILFAILAVKAEAQPYTIAKPGALWVPATKSWVGQGEGTYPWTLTPRTGLRDETFPFYPNSDYPQYNTTTSKPPWAIKSLFDSDTIVRAKFSQYYISEYVQGYLEYLPTGYTDPAKSSQTYPLIIYFPGCGEMGSGTLYTHPPVSGRTFVIPNYFVGMGKLAASSQGSRDLFNSLPRELIFNGDYFSRIPMKTPGQVYPASGGPTQGVIVMACVVSGRQDICGRYETPSIFDIEKVIAVARNNYRVDISRIFVTGMSAGGGVSYLSPAQLPNAARQLAGIVPVAAVDNIYANDPNNVTTMQETIIDNGVNVFAITNLKDFNYWVISNNQGSINQLQAVPGVKPGQVVSSFFTYPANDPFNTQTDPMHNAWAYAYRSRNTPHLTGSGSYTIRPNYTPYVDPVSGEGYTTYEWMVTKQNLALLPVNVINFTASRINVGVKLDWTTAQEINADHFTLERSSDGVNYNKMQEFPSAGNTNTERKYTHTDADLPGSQYVYYRLSQTDRDGRTQIIGVKKVYIGNTGFEAKVYPSVTTGNLTLEIQGLVSEPLNIRIVDLAGRLLMQKVMPARQNRISLDVSRLARGMYMIQVAGSANNFTTKFIKQ